MAAFPPPGEPRRARVGCAPCVAALATGCVGTGSLFVRTSLNLRPGFTAPPMPLEVSITRQPGVSADERETMLALYSRYFDNVRRDKFFAELAEKDWVILLRDGDEIAGFSTQRVIDLPVHGRIRHFLFSGDTVVDRAHWREHALAGAFGHLVLRLLERHGEGDCYWFLTTKGHRTYRFLPVFFERYIPGSDMPDDPRLRELVNAIAAFRFGPAFDPASGIIRADRETDRLRPEFAAPPERQLGDPAVAFFLQKNPRYAEGDDLACLTELRRDNLNRFAWRVIERTTPVWVD